MGSQQVGLELAYVIRQKLMVFILILPWYQTLFSSLEIVLFSGQSLATETLSIDQSTIKE